MACNSVRLHLVGLIVCGLAVAWSGELASAADGQKGPTSFTEIKRAVLRHFDKTPDYRSGDIISRSDVESLFGRLERLGWTAADRKEILKAVPADNNFLVKQLRAPAGRKFMRNIAKYPDAFDRLDRLSRLPYGKNTIKALIRGPDGYKMIEYMTTTHGGRQMGKMLSDAPKGTGFNKPTGRIYTVKQLLTRLKQSYESAISGQLSVVSLKTCKQRCSQETLFPKTDH